MLLLLAECEFLQPAHTGGTEVRPNRLRPGIAHQSARMRACIVITRECQWMRIKRPTQMHIPINPSPRSRLSFYPAYQHNNGILRPSSTSSSTYVARDPISEIGRDRHSFML